MHRQCRRRREGHRPADDYKEQVERFFGKVIRPAAYGMTELAQVMPRCEAGRYHRAPGLIWLVLDRDGERVLTAEDGETASSKAVRLSSTCSTKAAGAASSPATRSRWTSSRAAPAGRTGPTLFDSITRFAQVGRTTTSAARATIDGYIRGEIGHDTLTLVKPTGGSRNGKPCPRLPRDQGPGRRSAPSSNTVRPLALRHAPRSTSMRWSGRAARLAPHSDVPLAEIMDVMVATGDRLTRDPDGLLAEALEHSVLTSPLPRACSNAPTPRSAASSTAPAWSSR
jgi:hypothetical protein